MPCPQFISPILSRKSHINTSILLAISPLHMGHAFTEALSPHALHVAMWAQGMNSRFLGAFRQMTQPSSTSAPPFLAFCARGRLLRLLRLLLLLALALEPLACYG